MNKTVFLLLIMFLLGCISVSANLIHYWDMEEVSGTVLNDTASWKNATMMYADRVVGMVGSAVQFNNRTVKVNIDSFEDGSINTSIWQVSYSDAAPVETGGYLQALSSGYHKYAIVVGNGTVNNGFPNLNLNSENVSIIHIGRIESNITTGTTGGGTEAWSQVRIYSEAPYVLGSYPEGTGVSALIYQWHYDGGAVTANEYIDSLDIIVSPLSNALYYSVNGGAYSYISLSALNDDKKWYLGFLTSSTWGSGSIASAKIRIFDINYTKQSAGYVDSVLGLNPGSTGNFSIATWVKPEQAIPSWYGGSAGIISLENFNSTGGTRSRFVLAQQNTAFRLMISDNESSQVVFNTTPIITAGNWYHVVSVINRVEQQAKIYVNGVLMNNASIVSLKNLSVAYNASTKFGQLRIGSYNPFYWFNGTIDEVSIFDTALDQTEVLDLYSGKAADEMGIGMNWSSPLGGHSYSTTSLDFSFSINATYYVPVNCSLYQNGVVNQSITGIVDVLQHQFTVNYSGSEAVYNYSIYCVGLNGKTRWTENRSIYIDDADPDVYTNFVNLSSVFYQNLVGQFNFSDPYLYSFNISIDGATVANKSNMVVSDYSYNLSYNPVNLSVGVHVLQVRVSDGHTARAIPAWSVREDGVSKGITYDFGNGWVKITPVRAKDFSSSFSTTKLKDRYSFRYVRDVEEKKVHGGDLLFRVTSSHPISVSPRTDYPGWLIVEGLGKWIDFATGVGVKGYSVSVVDEFTVDVSVRGVDVDDVVFRSIGDLNIVTQNYSFYKGNYSVGWASLVPESTAAVFTINFTKNSSFIADIGANLFYNVTNYSATKTVYADNVFFSKTLTPWGLIDNSSLNVSMPFYWNFTVTGSSNFSNVSATNMQVVYKLLINNCSQYTSTVALVLKLWDEETGLPVNGTIASTIRVWYAGYSSLYRDYSFDFVGLNGSANSSYSVCVYPPSAVYQASTDVLGYEASGYVGRNYVFENLSLSNVSQTINLYLLDSNSSSDVTLTVYDNNGQEVEGELIQVLKFDPGTGMSVLVEAVRSDDNGEALVSLVLAGPYYWFVLSQGGVIHLQTSPAKLITSEKFFTISLYGDLYESYRKLFNVYYDLVFVNSSNTFRFVWADTQNLVRSACLNVSREDAFGEVILYGECVESAAGSISYSLVEDTAGKVYVGTGWIDTNTEYSNYYVEKIVASFRTSLQTYGKDGLVASLFLVLGVVGALVPGGGTLVIVGALLGSVMSVLLGLWHVSWLSVITIIILGGILLAKART